MLNELIGNGRTANVYKFDDNRVVKLFNDDVTKENIKYEYDVNKIANTFHCPTPKVFEMIEIDGKIGIVFEKIIGQTIFNLLKKTPTKVKQIATHAAKAHLDIHKGIAPQLKNQFEYFKHKIDKTELLTEQEKRKIIAYLYKLPSDNKLCHGDLHPDNFLVNEKNYYIIDWITAYSGSPASDVARAMLIMNTPFVKTTVSKWTYPIVKLLNKEYEKYFIKVYVNNSSMRKQDLYDWLLPVAAARLCENVPLEKEWLLGIIKKELCKYSTNATI
ncbi:MAG: aminoglycoside phosphotransferase family protein [Candidatus Marinimicrobia bacterium]|nr:aminoglycoside phosphotransferase family protein [Candidatus Neomarinimicrobiota bacterium]